MASHLRLKGESLNKPRPYLWFSVQLQLVQYSFSEWGFFALRVLLSLGSGFDSIHRENSRFVLIGIEPTFFSPPPPELLKRFWAAAEAGLFLEPRVKRLVLTIGVFGWITTTTSLTSIAAPTTTVTTTITTFLTLTYGNSNSYYSINCKNNRNSRSSELTSHTATTVTSHVKTNNSTITNTKSSNQNN